MRSTSTKVPSKNAHSPATGSKPATEKHKDDRVNRIAKAAYYKAEARGFEPGHDMEDWFAAEAEVA